MISVANYFPYYQNLTAYLSVNLYSCALHPRMMLLFAKQEFNHKSTLRQIVTAAHQGNGVLYLHRVVAPYSEYDPEIQFQFVMGKIKTKYPLQLELDFMLFLETSELIRESYSLTLDRGSLEYQHLRGVFDQFLATYQINYEAYMFFQPVHADREELITSDWTLTLDQIEEHNRYIIIKVKSHTQYMKDLFYEQLENIIERVSKLEEKIANPLPKEEEYQIKLPTPSPMLHHASSFSQPFLTDKDLDIGILFSEPIFDDKKHKEANLPVDFRSELQRLYSALNNSYKPEITVECQIATKQHLKHLICYKKPKILHIICHGTKDGELQFEDDSKFSIGALNSISIDKIRDLLKDKKDLMPSLVFINSCHSEIIGKIFYEAGAKYCIMIDSQDKIDDEAAQIFSQNFYRNIFRGQRVGIAFKEAQDNVKIKHNSSGCCCRHTARQKHKPNCRWLKLCSEMGQHEAHRMYHIPSQKCNCELRNINQHDLTCEWAQFSLFHINNDFRINDGGVERFPKKKAELPKYLPTDRKKLMLLICCCFNFEEDDRGSSKQQKEVRIPHSESNKFKMLPADAENTESLYQLQKNVAFRTQIIDFSAPELIESHQRVSNSSVMGRQQELYEFMKTIKDNQYNIFFLYGHPGVGKTTFAIKSATYLIERRVFEIYFFIDLFDIKDRDMFRNKFNEVTMLGYPFNKNSINQVKNKPIIIIFDNIDQFLLQSLEEFEQEMQGLKKQFQQTKFILTCRQNNLTVLENLPIYMDSRSIVRELKVLDQNTAAKALFAKIRNYLDISISYFDIREIVASKQELRIPKMIENLSHSFSHTKGKVKLAVLQQKVSELGHGDLAFNKLIEENLNILKNRCKQSYDMLIFISQFSQGIDKNDFNILGTYDRGETRIEGFDSAIIDIPIDRNWKKRLAILFEKNKELLPSQLSKIESETDTIDSQGISFDRKQTTIQPKDTITPLPIPDDMFECQSYFLEEISRNRFVVRRFIRDFIWNKDRSDENYYMKHIFVAYTAVMLDIYLNFLVSEKYIHEELLQYSDISQAGIFKYKDNNYVKTSLTESIRYVEDYNTRFERILKQQPALREKIRSSDPSVFIMNHKLDFLHIYGYDWSKIYQYLLHKKKRQASVLINYLQRLIILIPTAMKIANMQQGLIKYSIRQSIQLLAQIRRYSKPAHNLMLTLKLKLMKAASEIEKGDENLIPNTQFQKDFHKTDLDGIDTELLKALQSQFNAQIQVLEVYLQYIRCKSYCKMTESSLKLAERIVETIRKVEEWINNHFEEEVECQILAAKRKLIFAMIYNKILEASMKVSGNVRIIQFKNNAIITSFVKIALDACKVFNSYRMTKLTLRSKMIAVTINWEQLKTKIKQHQFSREFEIQRTLLRESEELYEDKRNNLIGLTIFDSLMKRIKKEMKERVWEQSANNLVVMKAVPLSNKNNLILENIVRKKPRYRKDMESIFRDAQIDLSIKVEILTAQRLSEQTKRPSTILILNTNFRTKGDKVYLICQDSDLKEVYLQINSEFLRTYPFNNTKLLILMGANASEGFKKITSLFQYGPSILSITTRSTDEFDQFEQCNYDELFNLNSSQELKKAIEHNTKVEDAELQFGKELIKALINPKVYQKGIKDIYSGLMENSMNLLKDFKVDMRQSSKQVIKMSRGKFMDLSPGFRKANNIDVQFKNSPVSCVYRKWKELTEVFKEFNSKRETKYIQICGGNGIGKTTFIQELGRICIERGLFQSGIYIINGKEVEQKYQSDFEIYIAKMSQASTGMFNLQSFNKYADSNFLLMIDDFHLIRPRSNGRYNFFLKKLFEKKVNIIFVTHESYNMRSHFQDLMIKTIKIERLAEVQLNIFAYNLLKSENIGAIEQYEEERRKRKLNCVQISKIYQKHLSPRYNNFLKMPEEHMRKLISNKH